MKNIKRIASLLLAVLMLFCMIPLTSQADTISLDSETVSATNEKQIEAVTTVAEKNIKSDSKERNEEIAEKSYSAGFWIGLVAVGVGGVIAFGIVFAKSKKSEYFDDEDSDG